MLNSYVLLIIVVIIYSSNLIVGKTVTETVPPFTLALLRIAIASLVIVPIGYRQWRNNKELWIKEWKVLIGLSLTGLALFNGLVYLALNYTTTINAGIVESTTPIFSVIIGFFLLKERFTKLQYTGVALSLIGVFWILTQGSLETIMSLTFNRGDLFMVVAIVSWVFYSMLVKQHAWKFPIYGSLLVMNIIAIVFLFPFALFEWPATASIEWTTPTLLSLSYLGIFPSFIALLAWNRAVGDIGPSKASIFLNLMPIFTAVGAVLFLNETVTWRHLIGGALILMGVFMTTKKTKVKVKQKVEKAIDL